MFWAVVDGLFTAKERILHKECMLRFLDISFSPTIIECMPPGSSPIFPWTFSFSMSFPMVMNSWESTIPFGWFWKKFITSSSALRASSCEGGEIGEDMLLLLVFGEDEEVDGWGGGGIEVGLTI